MGPQKITTSSSLEPVPLWGVVCRCHEVRDLDIRVLPWMIWVGCKCYHTCPYKREAEEIGTEEGEAVMEAVTERCGHRPRNASSSPRWRCKE